MEGFELVHQALAAEIAAGVLQGLDHHVGGGQGGLLGRGVLGLGGEGEEELAVEGGGRGEEGAVRRRAGGEDAGVPAETVGLPQPLQRLRSGAGEEDGIGSLPLQLSGSISGMGGP